MWPSNETIARETGLRIREVERGIAYLKANGMISVRNGKRQGCKPGRIITLRLVGSGANPVVRYPKPAEIERIWRVARGQREKPIALVTLMVALLILAAVQDGCGVDQSTGLHVPLSAVRAMVGASIGSTFTLRLDDLESAGLISRVGKHWRDGIIVHPPTDPAAKRQPRARTVPPQLRRFPRQPPSAGMTLADLDEQRASEASARAWARPPGPWWDEQPWPW